MKTMNAWQSIISRINADHLEHCSLLNLNASENHTSQLVRYFLANHATYDCYEFPPSGGDITGIWEFSTDTHNQHLYDLIAEQALDLLGSKRINVRAKGGQAAEIAVLLGMAKRGDKVFYVQELDGGHFGLNDLAKRCGIKLIPIPFDADSQLIDLSALLKQMEYYWQSTDNKLIIINQSMVLREQQWKKLNTTIKTHYSDCIITVDVSHILGLICGKQMLNPLTQGIDIIHGSTHKTFPGPQKGMIVFHPNLDEKYEHAINNAVSPTLQSNCGTAEILALSAALYEMQIHAKPYANAVCRIAKIMATELVNQGLIINGEAFDWTETHQCHIIIGNEQQAWKAFSILHQAKLRAMPIKISHSDQWGIRLGTNALVRRGLTEIDFKIIAHWIAELLKKATMPKIIADEVIKLAGLYPLNKLKYTEDYLLNKKNLSIKF